MIVRLLIAFVVFLVLSSTSCQNCRSPEILSFQPGMYVYFGMYQPGNWWTYESEDGLFDDSLFVYGYNEYRENFNDIECINFPTREFSIHTNNMVESTDHFNVEYANNGERNVDFIIINPLVALIYDSATDNYPRTMSFIPATVYDTITVAGILYNDVISWSDPGSYSMYFAPNVGLIRLTTSSGVVFNLTDYHIK